MNRYLVLLFFTGSFVLANDPTISEAINVAGRNRMLSQKIASAYLQTGALGNFQGAVQKAHINLDHAVTEFDANINFLQGFVTTDKAKQALENIEDLWYSFSVTVVTKPTKTNAKKVLEESTDLLGRSQKLVVELETLALSSSAPLVNLAGRQRMLAQRVSKAYIGYYWGFREEQFEDEMYTAIKEFDDALIKLKAADINTRGIKKKLRKVSKRWTRAKKSFAKLRKDTFSPLLIVQTTDELVTRMDQITNMYVNLSK